MALVAFLVLSFLAAAIGGRLTAASVRTWYPLLRKPTWTPPSWVFGPVWTLLYTLMAVAAWLVWRQVGPGSEVAAYGVQLALNVAWSYYFFGRRSPRDGVVAIVLLWIAIAVTLVLFWRVTALAGWLFVPYLAWVSLAGWLNFNVWRLNR
jgi:tryptophan-rich sensory protein